MFKKNLINENKVVIIGLVHTEYAIYFIGILSILFLENMTRI